jgi:hypothetical protein
MIVVKIGQVVAEGIVSVLFSDKPDSDHYDATLPAYEKKLGTNENPFFFYKQALLRKFHLPMKSVLLFYQVSSLNMLAYRPVTKR